MSLRDLPKDRAQGMENNALNRGNLGTRISGIAVVDIDMQQDDTTSTSTSNTMDDHLKSSKQLRIAQVSENVTSGENHYQDQNVGESGRSSGISGEWQGKSANLIQIQVCSSDKGKEMSQ
ncbi:hypothetical protein BGX26_009049 [Mortierella sp. AD094]|nr:hypothetical protein BGX26_009049 [Mortierella sp. AD094]